MENTNIILMTLDESSIEQQVHVYRSAFEPTSSVEDNISTWRKKHYENPTGGNKQTHTGGGANKAPAKG